MSKWVTGTIAGAGALVAAWFGWTHLAEEPESAPGVSAIVEQPSGTVVSGTGEQSASGDDTELAAVAPSVPASDTGADPAEPEPEPDAATPTTSETGSAAVGDGEGQDSTGDAPPDGAPRFDVVRVDKDGQMVIAGTARPGETVEILLDGEVIAEAETDPQGAFVAVVFANLADSAQQLQLRVPVELASSPERADAVAEGAAPPDPAEGTELAAVSGSGSADDAAAQPAGQDAEITAVQPVPTDGTGEVAAETATSQDTPQVTDAGPGAETATEPVATEPGTPETAAASAVEADPGATSAEQTGTTAEAAQAEPTVTAAVTPKADDTGAPAAGDQVSDVQASGAQTSDQIATAAAGDTPADDQPGATPTPGDTAETLAQPVTDSEPQTGAATPEDFAQDDSASPAPAEVETTPEPTEPVAKLAAVSPDKAATRGLAEPSGGTPSAEIPGTEDGAAQPTGTPTGDSAPNPTTTGTHDSTPAVRTDLAEEPRFVLSAPVIILPSPGGDTAPALVTPGQEDLELLQPGGPASGVVLDRITYGDDGEVRFRGRGTPEKAIRIYGNAEALGTARVSADGDWAWSMARSSAEDMKLFRFDELDGTGGVTSRIETPFRYSSVSPQVLRDRKVVIQKGDILWRIAEQYYGAGIRYSAIYGANADLIRDPDLIYPGQVFSIPELVDAN